MPIEDPDISNEELINRLKKGEDAPVVPETAQQEVQEVLTQEKEPPVQQPEYEKEELFASLPGEYEDGPQGHVVSEADLVKEEKEHKHNEGMELAAPLPHPVATREDPFNVETGEKSTKKKAGKEASLGALIIAIIVIGVVLWGGTYLYNYFGLYIVSPHTIHWHTELIINTKGTQVTIPASVGIKGRISNPSSIHTHEADNIVHWHTEDTVRAKDVMLREFFRVWGEDFDRDHIMTYKRGRDGIILMLVNGEVNHDYERYVVKDGDKIEILVE